MRRQEQKIEEKKQPYEIVEKKNYAWATWVFTLMGNVSKVEANNPKIK